MADLEEQGTVTADNGFTMLPDWILEHPDISDRALRVWLILMSYARSKDVKAAWLGRKRMAANCGCSVDTIDRAIKELVNAGALSVQNRFRDDGSFSSNNYYLHTSPQQSGKVAATLRRGRRADAAPREKALDGDPSSPLSRRTKSAATTYRPASQELDQVPSSTPVSNARLFPGSWSPNHTHLVVAQRLGLDITEMVEEFQGTYAVEYEKRSDWDKTFTGFMNDFDAGNYWTTA